MTGLHRSQSPRIVASACLLVAIIPIASLAAGFYRYGNGRTDHANRYDLAGNLFPAPGGNPVVFDFGNIGAFAALPPGLTAPQVNTAAKNAGNAWEKWANVKFGDTTGAAGAGLVRLTYDATDADGAGTWGYQHPRGGGVVENYAEMVFGMKAGPGVAWNATNFEWVLTHELGHVLGLRDLYNPDFAGAPWAEEFVDHFVAGNPMPDRRGRTDNLMDRYEYSGVNDYSVNPQTIIDNDSIAGVTWIWNAPRNHIVTGDLALAWSGTASAVRITELQHGDQQNPLTWWDYRGTVATAGGAKPYIELDFPGYATFAGTTFGATTPAIVYGGNQGGFIERFIIDETGWIGNFELFVKSIYDKEQRIRAWVVGGRTDNFTQDVNQRGRNFDGNNTWAKVFGPKGPTPHIFWIDLGVLTVNDYATNTPGVTATRTAAGYLTQPKWTANASMRASATLVSGSVAGIFGGFLTQPQMAVGGTLRLCLISPNCTGLSASIPLTSAGSGVGLGGAPISGTISTVVSSAPVFARFSIHGAPWTIRTRWVPFVGTSNSGIYTISSTGYAETPLGSPLTLSTVGTLHMVSPVRVGTSLSPIEHGGFVTLTVKYVPEPTLGVLLASGAAVLGLLGRRRRR